MPKVIWNDDEDPAKVEYWKPSVDTAVVATNVRESRSRNTHKDGVGVYVPPPSRSKEKRNAKLVEELNEKFLEQAMKNLTSGNRVRDLVCGLSAVTISKQAHPWHLCFGFILFVSEVCNINLLDWVQPSAVTKQRFIEDSVIREDKWHTPPVARASVTIQALMKQTHTSENRIRQFSVTILIGID